MENRFKDKVVLITGGSGSIGFITAKKLAEQGAKVMITDINEDVLKQKQHEAASENLQIQYVQADVTKAEDVKKYVDACINTYGKIDFFFNNAGIEGKVKPMHEYPDEVFDKVMAVNVKGVYLGMKHVIPKIEDGGSIVITSSVAGLQGTPGMVAYITSKHATIGIMRTAALELGKRKIRVNTVNPGVVDNRMMRSLEDGMNPGNGEEVKKSFEKQIPLQRYAEPEDVSNMVMFLFSDESKYANGGVFVVDGGLSA
ncbi:SDR family NAD(P)-dependent oxidoreductase [Mariniflexile sp.]|uniref:SDR family NAD(P)-dependent oxidoreductase n=1 Tax=Mariniflexile sp. TaxID=1979402 RepID=UPI0040482394